MPRITADDLRDYVRRVFARNELTIAIVGDIDAKTAGELIDRAFGALPAKNDLKPVPAATPQGLGRRIVIDVDVPQAVVTFGGIGIARNDPDFMAAYIVNHILGGGSFSSRLYREVREKRGLAYGVSDSLVWFKRAAVVLGGTATRADRTAEALAIIEKETKRMADERPDRGRARQGQVLSQGRLRAVARHLEQDRRPSWCRSRLDNLGIDYIAAPRRPDRRRHDRRRQARRPSASMAAACWSRSPAGRRAWPRAGLSSIRCPARESGASGNSACPALPDIHISFTGSSADSRTMTRMQQMPSISHRSAPEQHVGPHGVADRGARRRARRAPRTRSTGCARATPTARLPLLRLPEKTRRPRRINEAAARLRDGRQRLVVLGTGGSSLGGQTLAQLAGYGVPGVGALREPPRMHFIDNLDPATFGDAAGEAAARDHALCRHLEIRRHRRDPDADHRGAVGR